MTGSSVSDVPTHGPVVASHRGSALAGEIALTTMHIARPPGPFRHLQEDFLIRIIPFVTRTNDQEHAVSNKAITVLRDADSSAASDDLHPHKCFHTKIIHEGEN